MVDVKLVVLNYSAHCFMVVIIFFALRRQHKLQVIQKQVEWTNITFMWPYIVTNFFIIKPSRCTNFTNLFCHETLHVSGSSSTHYQVFIHRTLGNGICHVLKKAVSSWSCSKAVFKPVRHTPLRSVQWINSWWWADELPETCRGSCQNKFVKLVHLVGFITRTKQVEWTKFRSNIKWKLIK